MPKQPKITSNPQRRETLRRQQQERAAAARRMRTVVRAAWIAGITAIALVIGVTVWVVGNARSTA
ncbi:MAG: hypothetical protein KBG85_13985, partial [Micropruina sp.]|nr:hypothetical protein [Micropruina sp.]